MGDGRRRASTARAARARPEIRNIQAIIELERQSLVKRSTIERLTDRVAALASSPAFIGFHLLWFSLWIGVNSATRLKFDSFPFSLLTLAVSLEAIVLTGFVLMAQSRMTLQADKRAHLDLQINLLAEQELTAILKVLSLVAERTGVDISTCGIKLEPFIAPTDVRTLSEQLDQELATVGTTDAAAPVASADSAD